MKTKTHYHDEIEKDLRKQESQILVYRTVFNRKDVRYFSFEDFILRPNMIFESFGIDNYVQEADRIKNISDKEVRNEAKRVFFPAVDLSNSGVLSIDIDGINSDKNLKESIIKSLKKLPCTYAVTESVSGNIVAFFKYDCAVKDFPFLYYKLYLELTLLLSVNIDFLPEIGRLRYLSLGEVYLLNPEAEVLTQVLRVERLPYINTQIGKDKARKIVYGSK